MFGCVVTANRPMDFEQLLSSPFMEWLNGSQDKPDSAPGGERTSKAFSSIYLAQCPAPPTPPIQSQCLSTQTLLVLQLQAPLTNVRLQ